MRVLAHRLNHPHALTPDWTVNTAALCVVIAMAVLPYHEMPLHLGLDTITLDADS